MPRKVGVTLELDAAVYIAEAKIVHITTKEVKDDVEALGREANATGRDLDELGAQAALTKREIDSLGRATDDTDDDLKKLDKSTAAAKESTAKLGAATDEAAFSLADLGKSSKTSQESITAYEKKLKEATEASRLLDIRIAGLKTSVHDLGVEFANTGDAATGKTLSSERSMLGRLTKVRAEMEEVIKAAQTVDLPSIKLDPSALTDKLMPALIGLAVLASPAIGAIVSGAVVGGVGLGGIAGGVIAAAHDDRVKAAWAGFTKDLTADTFGAKAFVDPVIQAIHILESGFAGLHIGDILGKAADAVPKLAQGFVAFANGVMPGVSAALDHADEIADIFGQGLSDVGYALGDMIKDFSESEGAMDGLRLAFSLITETIEIVNAGVTDLGDAFHWLSTWTPAVGDAMAKLYVWMPPLHDMFQKNADAARDLGDGGGTATASIKSLRSGVADATQTTKDYADAVANATEMTKSMSEAWDALHGKTLSADEALLAAKKSVEDLAATFQDGTKSVQGNSQAAVENRVALEHAAEKAAAAATAYFNLTGDMVGANKIMADAKEAAEKASGATGKQRDEVNKLSDALFNIPSYVPVNVNVVTTYTYRGVPNQARKQDILDYEESITFGRRAAGGPVGPGMYWVGEQGPELLSLGQGSTGHVYPAGSQSWQAATSSQDWRPTAAAPSGSTTPVNLTVQLVDSLTGKVTRQVLINDALSRNQPASVVAAAYP